MLGSLSSNFAEEARAREDPAGKKKGTGALSSLIYGTAEGRELYAVVASKNPANPVVLVQAGIHAGEIDGKDAGLMLLRDIALRGKDRLLDKATLVFVPVVFSIIHRHYGRARHAAPAIGEPHVAV